MSESIEGRRLALGCIQSLRMYLHTTILTATLIPTRLTRTLANLAIEKPLKLSFFFGI